MTYTTTIYDDLRRRGWTAGDALRVARADAAAGAAGIDRFPQYMQSEAVTIDGRRYLLTVEPDPDGWQYGDDDVTGRVLERARSWYDDHAAPLEPGMVALDDRYAYDPGPAYDAAEHLAWSRRQGMARHTAWLAVRADLLREAEPYVRERDYGEPRNWIVTLTDETGEGESLCGVDLGDPAYDRSYAFEVATDLASELEYRRVVDRMEAGAKLAAATCHG